MTTDIDQSVESVKAALRAHPRNQLTGAQVHAVIQNAAPDLDVRAKVGIPTGSGALRRFVDVHLQDVLTFTGTRGDILYEIVGRTPAAQNESLSDVWKTFVSPNSSTSLVLKRDEVRLVSRWGPANTRENEIEIFKATQAEHDQIRSNFETELPPEEAQAFSRLNDTHESFHDWILALRNEIDRPPLGGPLAMLV